MSADVADHPSPRTAAELLDAPGPSRVGRLVRTLGCALPGLLLLALLSQGTLGAGLISDDGAALGYVHRVGPFADVLGPQYGLDSIRFWRPWVTASLGLQLGATGIDPLAFRAFNLACMGLALVLAAGLGRRVGGHFLAGLTAALLLASFAFQGGTVTWVVGRVDSQCLPGILLAIWGCVARRQGWALLGLVLACGTKESGFVSAPAGTVLLMAAGRSLPSALSQAAPLWLGTAALVVLRRMALGEWVGGYSVEVALPWGALPSALFELVGNAWRAHLGVILLALALRFQGRAPLRALLGSWLLFLGPALLLVPLVSSGELAPEHRRWLCIPEALMWIGAAALWQPRSGARLQAPTRGFDRRQLIPAVVLLVVVAEQGYRARLDTLQWGAAGRLAESYVERVRTQLEEYDPSPLPVWDATPPRVTANGGAYVLHWGVADRFRAPFPSASRPVWPWRPIWGHSPAHRDPVRVPRDDLRWGFDDTLRTVPDMPLALFDGDQRVEEWELDNRILELEPSPDQPRLRLFGEYPTPRIEFVLFTELGHEPAVWAGRRPPVAVPGLPAPAVEIPLREILMSVGESGVPLYEALSLAAQFGAVEAYLEVRAVDDARGRANRPVSASRLLRLVWTRAWAKQLLGS